MVSATLCFHLRLSGRRANAACRDGAEDHYSATVPVSAYPVKVSPMADANPNLRTELTALFGSVLREQMPEASHAEWQRFKQTAHKWRSGELSGTAALEHVEALTPDLRSNFRRALWLESELIAVSARVSTRLETESRLDSEHSLPACGRVAVSLTQKSLRPLPAKRYPPYPQVQFVFDPAFGGAKLSEDQQRALAAIAQLLHARAAARPSPAASKDYSIRLRAEVLLLWQSPDGAEIRRSRGEPRNVGELGNRSHDTSQRSAPLLAELNDHFANSVHIDPRFANFVPFAAVHGLAHSTDSKGQGISPSVWIASAVHRQSWALQALSDALDRLALRLPQAQGRVLFGPRMAALHQRLALSNPAASGPIELQWPNQPLRQIVGQIQAKLRANINRATHFLTDLAGTVGSSPGSIPDLPRESGEGPYYKSAAHLLLDLKQLHQAVGETYGGVAFAWEARRVLILAGAVRFRWWPVELELDAAGVEDAASELGMRAGILRAPLAGESGASAATLATSLCAAAGRLANMLDAGSLSHKTRHLMGLLRAVAWTIRNVDPETTTALVLRGVNRPSEVLAALALMSAIDVECGTAVESNLSLTSRLGIVIGFGAGASIAQAPIGFFDSLWASEPFAEYARSRGGHIEVAVLGTHDVASTDLLAVLNYRARAASIAALAASRDGVCTPTLRCATIDDAVALLGALPRNAANQHVRLILPACEVESLLAGTDACADGVDRALAALTASCWLDDAATSVADWEGALADAMTATWAKHITKLSALGVSLDSHAPWFDAVRDWLPLLDLDASNLHSAPADRPVWLNDALKRAAQSLDRNHPKALAALAWRTWPKGCYSEVFPSVEAEWHRVAALLSTLLPDQPTSPQADDWQADADWLLQLASI